MSKLILNRIISTLNTTAPATVILANLKKFLDVDLDPIYQSTDNDGDETYIGDWKLSTGNEIDNADGWTFLLYGLDVKAVINERHCYPAFLEAALHDMLLKARAELEIVT